MVITSTQNTKIKKLRALRTKKGRQKYSQYIIEGVNILKDLPPHIDVNELYIKKSQAEKLAFLEQNLKVQALIVDDAIFDSVADTKTPNGAIATAKPKEQRLPGGDTIILLDNISDAGNVGAIIRTAAAKGVDTVFLYGDCSDIYSPKTVRASMGGIFYVNFKNVCLTDISELIKNEYEMIGLDMSGKSVYDFQRSKKIIIAVGNEARGLSDDIKKRCKDIVSIPIKNVESLNAAISLSVALYII